MEKPRFSLGVVMQRRPSRSRWVDFVWEPWGVLPGYAEGESRVLVDGAETKQWLHPGFTLVLHRDEAEGYYLNVSAAQPRVYILWRMEGEQALPLEVTASSEEAGRWLDGGHSVDGVAMPPEIFAWVGDYVEKNYRPEPKKRIKPRSFAHPKDRI
ncbi:MAG TPA: DUF3305 domain-containing protein [Burkholderiales bacterium]